MDHLVFSEGGMGDCSGLFVKQSCSWVRGSGRVRNGKKMVEMSESLNGWVESLIVR